MRIEEFPAFLSLENNPMAEALRRLREEDAADLIGSGELVAGWAEWPDG